MTYKRKGKEIEGSGSSASKKQSTVHNHGIHFKDDKQRSRYLQRVMACTIWDRKEGGMMRID